MAEKKKTKNVGPKPGEHPGKVVDVDVSSEMSDSFRSEEHTSELQVT